MNECLITHTENSEIFKVTFRFLSKEYNLDKQIHMERRLGETVDHFLEKIQLKIDKLVEKKKKRKKNASLPEQIVPNGNVDKIQLFRNEEKLEENIPCEVFLKNPTGLKLIVYDNEYSIRLNMPQINRIKLPTSIMVGFPSYPTVFEAQYTDKNMCEFAWYKSNTADRLKPIWEEVGTGYFYTPGPSDLGYRLKIVCHPKNETSSGPPVEVMSNYKVEAGPDDSAFRNRHMFTQEKLSGKSFRMVSYNILAEIYAVTEYSQQVLFSYCPPHALKMDYRKQLILKELMGYNADIICLQEVDDKVYKHDLAPALTMLHYDNDYNTKKDTREGLAIFFNRNRFDRLNFESVIIGCDVTLDGFDTVWSRIENLKAKERFLNRSTSVQVTTLRSKENPSEILVIGNTHLYFHPNADHIRLLQSYYALMYLRKVVEIARKDHPECNVSVIFCGDFNSTPDSGAYRLITENYVPADVPTWSACEEEEIKNVSLRHDLKLSSACGTPEYTNYTPTFSGCLDYIYYERENLGVEQVVPMPSKEEIAAFEGLPSVIFPSDHIALCADLKWLK